MKKLLSLQFALISSGIIAFSLPEAFAADSSISRFRSPNQVLNKAFSSFDTIASSLNEEAVVDQLESIKNASHHHLLVLDELIDLDPFDQLIALNQLSAVPYTNLFQTAELADRKFIRRLFDPLRKKVASKPSDVCDCPCTFLMEGWFAAGYDQADIHSQYCFDGLSLDGYDINFGAQTSLSPCFTMGIAGSYEHDTINYRADANGTNQTFLIGLYSLFRPADYYVLGDLVFGYGKYKVRRKIEIGDYEFRPRADPDLYQGVIYVEAGKDLPLYGCINTYLFQPFLGFEVGYFRYRHIHERASDSYFNISLNGQSHVPFNGRLGVHFTTELFSCLSFGVDAAWQHRFTSLDNHLNEQFQKFGESFSISGTCLSRDSFDGAIYIAFALNDNMRLYIEGAGQVWSHVSSYNTYAGIEMGW